MGNPQPILYHSTNDPSLKVDFKTALLEGQPKDYGLYTIARESIPQLSSGVIYDMGRKNMPYADIAHRVLFPFLGADIPPAKLERLLKDAYRPDVIPTDVQHVADNTHIMWLTKGPTYSFKDYAARFFGRALDHVLSERKLKRTVVVATSGDTGGAVADALHGLENVETMVFYPKDAVSGGQRRQMTTLRGNAYALEVNGDFDVCQALAKRLLNDKEFALQAYGDEKRLTSANSISVGRLLPQIVFPFYAHSRIANGLGKIIASVPSGNFGDIMGTVIAREMGLPISTIVCGVNENTEFPDFLRTGKYAITSTKKSPSSAMNVSHPSNLARLVDLYGGHMFDERDATGKIVRPGIVDRMPNMEEMRNDIFSVSISNPNHDSIMKRVHREHGIILDPHGAVAWGALERFREQQSAHYRDNIPAVIHETADPGKFPDEVGKAIGIRPEVPQGMQAQATLPERIFSIKSPPIKVPGGALQLSDAQIAEAKKKIREIALDG